MGKTAHLWIIEVNKTYAIDALKENGRFVQLPLVAKREYKAVRCIPSATPLADHRRKADLTIHAHRNITSLAHFRHRAVLQLTLPQVCRCRPKSSTTGKLQVKSLRN